MVEQVDILDQDVEEAQVGGGGGQVCQFAIYGAYKVFPSGMTPRETTFLYTNKTEKDAALKKAKAFSDKPQQTVCLVRFKDAVLTHDTANWKDDMFETYGPNWKSNPDYFLVMEKRAALGIPTGKKVWGRVTWITSPNAEANKEKDWAWQDDNRNPGEKMLKMIAIPVQVYADKKEAAAAAEGLATSGADDPTYPGDHTGWSLEDWQGMKAEIVAKYQELVKGIDGPAPVKAKKLEEAQKQVCGEYVITTLLGDPDVEKLKLLLAEAAV